MPPKRGGRGARGGRGGRGDQMTREMNEEQGGDSKSSRSGPPPPLYPEIRYPAAMGLESEDRQRVAAQGDLVQWLRTSPFYIAAPTIGGDVERWSAPAPPSEQSRKNTLLQHLTEPEGGGVFVPAELKGKGRIGGRKTGAVASTEAVFARLRSLQDREGAGGENDEDAEENDEEEEEGELDAADQEGDEEADDYQVDHYESEDEKDDDGGGEQLF